VVNLYMLLQLLDTVRSLVQDHIDATKLEKKKQTLKLVIKTFVKSYE